MQVKKRYLNLLCVWIGCISLLILMFFGCSDIKKATGDRIASAMIIATERYIEKYPEEAALIDMFEPFGFWCSLQKIPFEDNKVVKQVQNELSKSTGLSDIEFAPVVSLVKIHYPKQIMKIAKEDVAWIEYVYDEQLQKFGQTDTILRIIERDNDTPYDFLTAEFYTLLVWETKNNIRSKYLENPTWIYCQFEWDKQKDVWQIRSVGRLLKGEQRKVRNST